MITSNFKKLLSIMLSASSNTTPTINIDIKTIAGGTRYVTQYVASGFPFNVTHSVSLNNSTGTGILLGTGTEQPSEDDYQLSNMITSGITSAVTYQFGADNGNPYIEYLISLTNTTSSDITISEIGYSQAINSGTTVGSSNLGARGCLLDRTLLSTPVTVPANDSAAIKYKLSTVVSTASVA